MTHPEIPRIVTEDEIVQEVKEKGRFSLVLSTGVVVYIVRMYSVDYHSYVVRTLGKNGEGYDQYTNAAWTADPETRIRDCARFVLAMAYPYLSLETETSS